MVRFKQILCVLLFTISSGLATAQNNTNSPYTRYGYGQLSDQTFGNSKAMGGIAYGLRDKLHINPSNPASYTAVDSLTFLFDVGVTLQNTNVSDGTTKINAKNSSFDYVAMQFRLRKGIGLTLGMLPYSNVGYNVKETIESTEDPSMNHTTNYYGDGGLHQIFLGLGLKVFKNFSLGANVSYLWGETSKTRAVIYSTSGVYSFSEETNMHVNDFKFDFGAQYTHQFDRKNVLTIGATFTPKRSLSNDTYVETASSVVVRKDSAATFEIPNSFGAGFTYKYDDRLTLGIDYTLQKWGDIAYMDAKNAFCDYSKIAFGVEFLPSYTGRSLFSSIKYRAGAYYSEPYYKVQDAETKVNYRAAKEYGITAGMAIPMVRSRTVLNLSVQYSKVNGQKDNFLNENYLRFNIGITFNERWFAKLKVN